MPVIVVFTVSSSVLQSSPSPAIRATKPLIALIAILSGFRGFRGFRLLRRPCSQWDAALTSLQRQSSAPLYGIGTIRHKRQRGHWRLAAVPSVPFTVEHTAVCRRRWKLSFPGAVARFVRRSEDHHIHMRLLTTLEIAAHITSPSHKGLLKDHRIVCDTYHGLLGSVSKRGQYSETMIQLAKFSGPTAANGRHYRQRHAASGPTLGRLNY